MRVEIQDDSGEVIETLTFPDAQPPVSVAMDQRRELARALRRARAEIKVRGGTTVETVASRVMMNLTQRLGVSIGPVMRATLTHELAEEIRKLKAE